MDNDKQNDGAPKKDYGGYPQKENDTGNSNKPFDKEQWNERAQNAPGHNPEHFEKKDQPKDEPYPDRGTPPERNVDRPGYRPNVTPGKDMPDNWPKKEGQEEHHEEHSKHNPYVTDKEEHSDSLIVDPPLEANAEDDD